MSISGETASIIGVGLVALGMFISHIRHLTVMKEHIKTLFNKDKEKSDSIEKIEKSLKEVKDDLDDSVKSLSDKISNLHDAMKDSHTNLSSMIQKQHIKMLEKFDEKFSK